MSSPSHEWASNADLSYVHGTAAEWLELHGDLEVTTQTILGTHNGLSLMDKPTEPVAYHFHIEGGNLMDMVSPRSSQVLHSDTARFTYTPAYYYRGGEEIEYHPPVTRFMFDRNGGDPTDISSQMLDIKAVPSVKLVETLRRRNYFVDSPGAIERRRHDPFEHAVTHEEGVALRGVVRNLKVIKKVQQQQSGRIRRRYIGG